MPCQPFTKFQILTNREDTNFTNEYTKRNRQLRMQVFYKTFVSGFHLFGNRKFPQGFHWFGNRKFPEDMSSVPRLESLTFQRELQSPHSDNFSQIHQKYAFQKSQFGRVEHLGQFTFLNRCGFTLECFNLVCPFPLLHHFHKTKCQYNIHIFCQTS